MSTLPGAYIGLGYDNAPDFSNLLGFVLGERSPSADLRDCLTQCQDIEGMSPIECQARCRGLTPGDTGESSFLKNFFKGFSIPGGVRDVIVLVIAAILIIVALALLTR